MAKLKPGAITIDLETGGIYGDLDHCRREDLLESAEALLSRLAQVNDGGFRGSACLLPIAHVGRSGFGLPLPTLPAEDYQELSNSSVACVVLEGHVRMYSIPVPPANFSLSDVAGLFKILDDLVSCPLGDADSVADLPSCAARTPRNSRQDQPVVCDKAPLSHFKNSYKIGTKG